MSDRDNYTVFGTTYSKSEVFELERAAGKTTLVGDAIRFADARDDLSRAFAQVYAARLRAFTRFAERLAAALTKPPSPPVC